MAGAVEPLTTVADMADQVDARARPPAKDAVERLARCSQVAHVL